jgi:TonB family protein
MSSLNSFQIRRWLFIAAGVVVAVALLWFLWVWAHDKAGIKREAPKLATIIPLPPPPPPPPPKPPEPPKPEEQKIVQPTPEVTKPTEAPKPKADAPSPAKDLSTPMRMDADAQAGNDAFNIGAGSGGGMGGSGAGFGNGTYASYLGSMFQKILREDDHTKNLAFRVQANIWLTADGKISRVELVKSSGDAKVDQLVLTAMREAPALDERPPTTLAMPARVDLQGRRPS